jgi:hypothetical protein
MLLGEHEEDDMFYGGMIGFCGTYEEWIECCNNFNKYLMNAPKSKLAGLIKIKE